MDVFGSLRKLTKIVFPTNSGAKNVELQAANQTGSDPIVVSIPDVGDSTGTLVEIDASQTLTNKTIDGDNNTVQDLPVTAIKTVLADANKALVRNASGVPTSALIVNANVDAAAALARSKLASGTASHVIINDGSGVLSSEAQLAISRGGTNISTYTTGDFLYASASNVLSKLPIGTTGQLLRVSAGGVPEWFTGAGTGDVVGPASSTNGAVAVYNGTTGKLLQNGTKLEADLVTGPAASVDSEFAIYNSTTGKIIKRASGTGYAYGTSGVASFLSTIPAADIAGRTSGSPASGRIGEFTQTRTTASTSYTVASATYGDADSISLGAGVWNISVVFQLARGTSSFSSTLLIVGIGTASGTSTTGLQDGDNMCVLSAVVPTSFNEVTLTVPSYRVPPSGTTTYYLKCYVGNFSGANPTYRSRISATRVG
jgi:hypothetical protein